MAKAETSCWLIESLEIVRSYVYSWVEFLAGTQC